MSSASQNRLVYVDYFKSLALLFVISIHSINHMGFYESNVNMSWEGGAVFVLRALWVSCVPMFLIASGIVLRNTNTNCINFKAIFKVLITYFLCSILCASLDIVVQIRHNTPIDIISIIASFLNFTAAPYGWYVAMYIGLFLLAPFINKLWALLDNKSKIVLLIILFVLVILPNSFNSINYRDGMFDIYATRDSYFRIVDNFWSFMYPILYYCVGLYIRDSVDMINNKCHSRKLLILLLTLLVSIGIFNLFKNIGHNYGWALDSSYGGIQAFVVSIVACLVLVVIPQRDHKIIRFISNNTLAAYLLSYVVDYFVYIPAESFTCPNRIFIVFAIIPVDYIISIVLGGLVSRVNRVIFDYSFKLI